MRPTTPHYVLMVENSITYGRHFYAKSSIADSVYGVIHAFVLGHGITNALHDNTKTLLRRMMAMWYSHYVLDTPSECYVD